MPIQENTVKRLFFQAGAWLGTQFGEVKASKITTNCITMLDPSHSLLTMSFLTNSGRADHNLQDRKKIALELFCHLKKGSFHSVVIFQVPQKHTYENLVVLF